MVISKLKSLTKFQGKHIVPYFFEDGYENHQYGAVNATEAMERMEEMLDLFKKYTCVEFVRLKTEEEKSQYDYKIKIIHEGTCGGWSYLGKSKTTVVGGARGGGLEGLLTIKIGVFRFVLQIQYWR